MCDFCSWYLGGVETRFNQLRRNDDYNATDLQDGLSTIFYSGRAIGKHLVAIFEGKTLILKQGNKNIFKMRYFMTCSKPMKSQRCYEVEINLHDQEDLCLVV